MADVLVIAVVAIIAIVLATAIAPKLKLAGPLVLVAVGLGVSLLPFMPPIEVDPEWILVGVLPPLLYAAAVRLPAVEFRRDLRPIAGLSVLLVVVSSVVLGALFTVLIPGLSFPVGVALGAILSPTDAVATSIAKRVGISPRVITLLEGESLLNDATALVLLRTSVAAIAGGFAFGETVLAFLFGVVVAIIVGGVVGWVNLRVRGRLSSPTAHAALSFTIPFVAYLPTDYLGGSGLVAAVVAGIVTSQGAPRRFRPEARLSDKVNWSTIEFLLEGAVFLLMGLELKDILIDMGGDDVGLVRGILFAFLALGVVLVVRAAWVTALIALQGLRNGDRRRARVQAMDATLDHIDARIDRRDDRSTDDPAAEDDLVRPRRRLAAMRSRLRRMMNDLDYYRSKPLTWKHGTIIVWAGMRGVVTLAAAQTLPRDTDERSLLVFIAFVVAVTSLLVQGLTLPFLVRMLRLSPEAADEPAREERIALDHELRDAAAHAIAHAGIRRRDGTAFPPDLLSHVGARLIRPPDDDGSARTRDLLEVRLAILQTQRVRLVQAASEGRYSTAALRHALAELDADQLSVELRLDRGDD